MSQAGAPARRHRTLAATALALLALSAGGCATSTYQGPLYLWESFPRQQYETLLREGASPVAQKQVLEAQAEKARATGAALPPGFRAHLGMIALALGDADRAAELWTAEKLAFPEAAPFMDRLLAKLTAAGSPKPAGVAR